MQTTCRKPNAVLRRLCESPGRPCAFTVGSVVRIAAFRRTGKRNTNGLHVGHVEFKRGRAACCKRPFRHCRQKFPKALLWRRRRRRRRRRSRGKRGCAIVVTVRARERAARRPDGGFGGSRGVGTLRARPRRCQVCRARERAAVRIWRAGLSSVADLRRVRTYVRTPTPSVRSSRPTLCHCHRTEPRAATVRRRWSSDGGT